MNAYKALKTFYRHSERIKTLQGFFGVFFYGVIVCEIGRGEGMLKSISNKLPGEASLRFNQFIINRFLSLPIYACIFAV